MTATAYAFFIQDSDNQIVDRYPVVKSDHVAPFPNATRKLYSALPDAFDFVMVTTGEQLMSLGNFNRHQNAPAERLRRVYKTGALPLVDFRAPALPIGQAPWTSTPFLL